MSLHSWLQNLRSALAPGRGQRHDRRRGSFRAATHGPNLEVLEDRCVPALYAVTDLGTFDGNYSYASDLNESGQVVGVTRTADSFSHAFLWDNGTMIDLGSLGGNYSSADGINDLGQVVGSANLPGDEATHAFLVTPQGGVWFQDSDLDGRNDFMIDLGTLNASPDSDARDINNASQVVGASDGHSFVWDSVNGMTDLGVPPGFLGSYPVDINETGQVAVSAHDLSGYHNSTFLWDAANGMTALGAGPAYTDSHAADINEAGQVVGSQWDASTQIHPAFLWTPDSPNSLTGSFTDLGMLPGDSDSNASGINNAGQVVGTSLGRGVDEWGYYPHAFLWDAAGGMVNLQNQLQSGSDVTVQYASAINDGGAIAVSGLNGSGQDRAYLLTPVPPGTPSISVADAPAVTEGNAGTGAATFTVTLSAASTQTITVAYATGNDTATAGSDYQAATGTLTFAPGEISKTITVPVIGDRLSEPNEMFVVTLSSPTNATIGGSQAVGTIVDDEPRISIGNVTKKEGNGKKTTLFTFTVTLSAAYDQAVTMSFRTVNGTATTSDNDYIPKTGTLTFAPGETTKTITIEVRGDSKREANETFYLDLFGASVNSLFTKNRGIGTILNDD
jgi:probable HAF family extracellular repeat protein